ncbi:unnamed protein product [Euphydryas editha]|uniref:F-box domain-containing protein n=1 Tax=Euphydryas editha TaxID=104508 RepID=A0AAU9U2D7_EUPED|nr:unnamed protein product [Euphydryas editha]
MDNLPDEIVMMILSYINPLELSSVTSKVCKKWNDFIASRVIKIKRAEHYEKLHKGLQVILVTDAEPSVGHSDTLVSYAIRLTPRLRELTINCDFPLDKNTFKSLSALVHLRHLDVFAQKQFLNRRTHINAGIKSLVVNERISNGFLTSLKQLKLSAFHMYGRADHSIPREMESFLRVQAVYLRDLTLRCSEMTDERFKVLGLCVNLLSLQLYTCSMLTRNGIQPIVGLTELQRLHITGTVGFCTICIMDLITRLPPRIRDLNLSGSRFGNEHCNALVSRLPQLRSLELWCTYVESDAVISLAHGLRRLEVLDTDIELQATQIDMLEHYHMTLKKLRCIWNEPFHISTRMRLTSSLQVYPSGFRHFPPEGPSAELFYFWSRERCPRRCRAVVRCEHPSPPPLLLPYGL